MGKGTQRGCWWCAVFGIGVLATVLILMNIFITDFWNRMASIPIRISKPVKRQSGVCHPGVSGVQSASLRTPGDRVCGFRVGLKVPLLFPGQLSTATTPQPQHQVKHTHVIDRLHTLLGITQGYHEGRRKERKKILLSVLPLSVSRVGWDHHR